MMPHPFQIRRFFPSTETLWELALTVLIVGTITAGGAVIVSRAHADWTTETCGYGDAAAYQSDLKTGNRTFLIQLPPGRKLVEAHCDEHEGICVTTRPFEAGEPASSVTHRVQAWHGAKNWKGPCPEYVEIDERK